LVDESTGQKVAEALRKDPELRYLIYNPLFAILASAQVLRIYLYLRGWEVGSSSQ